MTDNATRLLIEELQELRESSVKKCEWCHQPLPNERYHLKICPKCRKATIDAFLKGELWAEHFGYKARDRLTIEISESHVNRISLHSVESHPIEACGILIGTSHNMRKVTDTFPAKNLLSSETSYEIDPESLFKAFTYAEKNSLEVIAFYHSHPFWSAEASAIDRARANYPGLSYVIYSIPNKEIRSFYFDGKELNSESVIVTTDKHSSTWLRIMSSNAPESDWRNSRIDQENPIGKKFTARLIANQEASAQDIFIIKAFSERCDRDELPAQWLQWIGRLARWRGHMRYRLAHYTIVYTIVENY